MNIINLSVPLGANKPPSFAIIFIRPVIFFYHIIISQLTLLIELH